MNASDLLDIKIPVEVGGRSFEMGKITLGAVLRILVRFDEELRDFAKTGSRDVEGLLARLSIKEMADLFAFLLSPYDPPFLREHLTREKIAEIVIWISSLNDLDRIWRTLNFASVETSATEQSAPSPPPQPKRERIPAILIVIDRLAVRYSVSPMSILAWGYESFLTITELVNREAEAFELASEGVDPDLLDDSGIKVEPIPKGAIH